MSEYKIPDYQVLQSAAAPPAAIGENLKLAGVELAWPETEQGSGIRIGIMDTGVPNHPDIAVAAGYDVTGSSQADRRGHGTHVAGIAAACGAIFGGAPKASLYPVKVFPDSDSTDGAKVAKAAKWLRETAKVDVINMSFGGPSPMGTEAETELRKCYEAGIKLVAAAGNYGRDYGVLYPARYSLKEHGFEVIAVAAVDAAKAQAPWSAVGMTLDVAVMGVEVWSTWLGGQYCQLDGTSMAAPLVTACIALLDKMALRRFGRKLTPEEALQHLRMWAEDLGPMGPDELLGCGVFSFGRVTGADRPQREVVANIGKTTYTVDGQAREFLVAPAVLPPGRAMFPLRELVEDVCGGRVVSVNLPVIKFKV